MATDMGREGAEGAATFAEVVAPLVADPAWRRQVRRARARAIASRVVADLVAVTGRGLGDVGACFVGAPSAAWAELPWSRPGLSGGGRPARP